MTGQAVQGEVGRARRRKEDATRMATAALAPAVPDWRGGTRLVSRS
ncbi:hypothetical protein AB0N07_47265 [Streptomyces sp. NPDC051172]